MLALRIGKNPRAVVTTTPRPTKLIKDLVGREGKDVVGTRGRTIENRGHLQHGRGAPGVRGVLLEAIGSCSYCH
jgi:phage terminase large subunit-like protein